jgi:hypothetical protein
LQGEPVLVVAFIAQVSAKGRVFEFNISTRSLHFVCLLLLVIMYIIVKSGAGATILTGCDQKIDKLKSENMEKSTHKKIM